MFNYESVPMVPVVIADLSPIHGTTMLLPTAMIARVTALPARPGLAMRSVVTLEDGSRRLCANTADDIAARMQEPLLT